MSESDNGMSWTNPVLGELMRFAQWSRTADDNATNETVPSSFYKALVRAHLADPDDAVALRNLGLLALTVGVSEWGVSGDDLPDDPRQDDWKSNSGPKQGKHVMSYDLGGVGISHVDSDELGRFIEFVAKRFIDQDAHRERFLVLANPASYRHSRIQFDQIRASGLCQTPTLHEDLMGVPFAENGHGGVSDKNCADWNNSQFGPADWQLFRTYVRKALRTESGQEWIFNSWLDRTWMKSVEKVLSTRGSIDQALANARVRNSSPVLADEALAESRDTDTPTKRIQREIDAYAKMNGGETARRRFGFIVRSINLYRHLANEAPLIGVRSP
ncbi:hypothetical protein G3N95_12150 [Paraburkholderia sp. Tr-20389]|uniref:hypothetical protein n=1 Tax=Paraburkholderia sp. Tr-20389 TaxID=2703903 RepID=UPI00197E9DBF|nr:hypothetical protein [Paraburkholderia sp. Tr-20389]MBN3753694.1 hypothetical protein [Paraburkholderia sp. Tr-20389]